jgi:hypothetical protein
MIMETNNTYSEDVIRDWRQYERVRLGGAFNMFDQRAIDASALSRDRYIFIMENYAEIKKAAEMEH